MAVGINILNEHGHLDKDATRAFFAVRGKLPPLKKKQLVYFRLDSGLYGIAELRRRLPGEVWYADVRSPGIDFRYCIVSVMSFGGVIEK